MSNFISLSGVRVAGFIFPLITLPYLVRVLGPEKYGLVCFAQALALYFVIFTDYGFNLSATREISINRNDIKKVSSIFWSVLSIKFILLLLSFAVFAAITLSFEKFSQDKNVYFYAFGVVLGQVLFPLWFFQGMEKMKYIAGLNILTKMIFTVAIFIFIRQEDDYAWLPLLYSLGFVISGSLGLWIAIHYFKIRFIIPSKAEIFNQFKEGWHVFVSTIAISLYTTSNTFILGIFTNNTIVGYYSAADKIIKAVLQVLLYPLSQTMYPHVGNLAQQSKANALQFIRKVMKIVISGTFVLSAGLFIFAEPLCNIVLGKEYVSSIIVLRILAFIPFAVALSNAFGVQIMLNFDLKKHFTNILIIAGCFNIIICVVLVLLYGLIGVSSAVLITEVLITVVMFWDLKRVGIDVVRGRLNQV